MKVQCIHGKLRSALEKTERVAVRNVSLPVLSCILLEAKDGTLIVRSTNLELAVEVHIPAKVETEGSVAVRAAEFRAYINSLSTKNITLETTEKTCTVTTDIGTADFNLYDASEFPELPKVEKGERVAIPANIFSEGIQSVAPSASTSSIKPELGSIFLTYDNGALVFAATDGFRLSEARIRAELTHFDTLLIPAKNALEIARLAADEGGELELSFSEAHILIVIGQTSVVSRIVDGSFPDYAALIPKEWDTRAIVLKQDLVDALRRAMIFSGKDSAVTVAVEKEGGKLALTLETRGSEVGAQEAAVAASCEGEPVRVSFNGRFITDVLSVVKKESIELWFNTAARPLLIRGKGQSDFSSIIMPMNK